MKKQKRSFTPEFKFDAATLVTNRGYTIPQAAKSLDVSESALRSWIKQLGSEQTGNTPTSKAITPEQRKIQELEARIRDLELEKTILKKATALLMTDEYKRIR